jgi:hypothetical protein
MLKSEIVEAVTRGEFHIWAVETVDQALEILTNLPAGTPDGRGQYPEGSIHGRAARRLAEDAMRLKSFSSNHHDPATRALLPGGHSNEPA